MDDLISAIDYIVNYATALNNGAHRWAAALPILTRQHISSLAKQKLHTTREDYMNAVNINMDNFILVVELDKSNFIANALENGIDGFSLKTGLLNSPKAKIGKDGHKYIRVPMEKRKDAKPGTEKGQEYQDRIMEVLNNAKFRKFDMKRKLNGDGSVFEYQKVVHNDPKVQGLYRTRKFDSPEELHSGKKKTWQYVLFRTVSSNPLSKAMWEHPGLKSVHILRDTELWLNQSAEILLENYIKEEIGRL